MIPFAILSGQLHISGRESVEIRILDLAPDGFTFRLPKRIFLKEDEKVEICLHFFRYAKNIRERKYEEVILPEISLIRMEQTRFWNLFRVETEKLEFREQAIRLSEEYLHYVDCRLNLGDAAVAQEMIGYPASSDEVFASSGEAQWKKWAEEIRAGLDEKSWEWICGERKSEQPEIAFCLEVCGEEMVQTFLNTPIKAFWERYLGTRFLADHPLGTICLNRIVVGSAFCPNLLPDVETVLSILEKAGREQLKVTVVLPPVSELCWDVTCEFIRTLSGKEVTLQLNDAGMQVFCAEQNFPGISIEKGVLMHKQKKDVRMRYFDSNDPLADTNISDDFANLDCSGTMLYFPFYQMNTATFCTLHASVVSGDRGIQRRVTSCPEYCREWQFLYPEHLHMVGRYNSLFGLQMRAMTEGNVLKQALKKGISQFVLNW